jgi:hypothetical protein
VSNLSTIQITRDCNILYALEFDFLTPAAAVNSSASSDESFPRVTTNVLDVSVAVGGGSSQNRLPCTYGICR